MKNEEFPAFLTTKRALERLGREKREKRAKNEKNGLKNGEKWPKIAKIGRRRLEKREKWGEIDENGIMAGVNNELREFREWGSGGKGAG